MAQQTILSLGFRVGKNRGGGHLFFLASIFWVSNYLIANVFYFFCHARSCSKIGLHKIACFLAQQTILNLRFRVGKQVFFEATII